MVRKTNRPKSYLTPNDVAEMLMVSPTTIRQWSSENKIKSTVTLGGHRRFTRSDVERFAREQGLTLQLPDDQTTRILIVDDDNDFIKYLIEVFSRVDASVKTMVANNGFEAGRLVQSFQPHVVLLDLLMPGMDGFEACQTIKQAPASKATRVVAMTGFYDDGNVSRILDAGAETCLCKPFTTETLLAAIGIEPARVSISQPSE